MDNKRQKLKKFYIMLTTKTSEQIIADYLCNIWKKIELKIKT